MERDRDADGASRTVETIKGDTHEAFDTLADAVAKRRVQTGGDGDENTREPRDDAS